MAISVTNQDLYNYLGIDYADNMVAANATRVIAAADAWMKAAIGTDYPSTDPKAKELLLIVAADFYENRTVNDKVSPTVRRLVSDLALQLRLGMRGDTDAT